MLCPSCDYDLSKAPGAPACPSCGRVEPAGPGNFPEHDERALIGCALHDLVVAGALLGTVEPAMFRDPHHARTWSALGRVVASATGPVDLLDAVAAELAGDADGPSMVDLHGLHAEVPSAENGAYYADKVRRGYARRELQRMMSADWQDRNRNMADEDLLIGFEQRARQLREMLAGGATGNLLPDPLVGDGWNEDPPDREWLVDGWLPVGELALLTGPGSVGKSVLVLQLGTALACDRDPLQHAGGWLPAGAAVQASPPDLGMPPAPVVLAGWEDDRYEALRRRRRMAMHGGCGWATHPSINRRLHVLPMRGYGPLWAPADTGSRHVSTVGAFTDSGKALLAYAEAQHARLLVIDPAGLSICTNENDRALVSLALDALAGWAMNAGCTVLLTGHPAKAAEGEAADYSGSTAWRGSVRALWTLKQPRKQEADRGSAEWAALVGRHPSRAERVARLSRNKNNYGWDGDGLTVATTGGRAGWYLTDPPPPPKGKGDMTNGGRDTSADDLV